MRKIIKASEGYILTNGEVYGRTIYLAEGEDDSAFYEITDKEYEEFTTPSSEEIDMME